MSRVILAVVLACAGCLDAFPSQEEGGADAGDPTGSPLEPPSLTDGPDGAKVGPRDLRRLSVREYENSLRDVFGLAEGWSSGLPPDARAASGFDNDTTLLAVDASRAQAFQDAAERAAATIVAAGFPQLAACAQPGRACAVSVVETYGPRLFRGALDAASHDRWLKTFDDLAALGAAPADALTWTLTGMLTSPRFLYRREIGEPGPNGSFTLTGEELAVALAYDFSASPPSEELLARGRAGALADPVARVAEARRLLDTPRGRALVGHFMQKWLRYDEVRTLAKDATRAPLFAQVRDDMAEETRRFLEDVFFTRKGSVPELFTSAETFVSATLAQHYGLQPPAQPFAAITRPPEQAVGLLAQGSILSRFALADSTSPPQRGAFIRRSFLCQELPPPPPNVGQPPTPQPGVTTRQRYEQVTSPTACAGCHRLLNHAGFALESFDLAGRFRATEEGQPIDASGTLYNFGSTGDRSFADAREAAQLLAHSPDVATCIAGKMSAYTFGLAQGGLLAPPAALQALASGTSLYDYFAQLAAAPHFALRIEK